MSDNFHRRQTINPCSMIAALPIRDEYMVTTVDKESVKRKLKFDYLRVKNHPDSKAIDGMAELLSCMFTPHMPTHEIIQKAANIIHHQYRLRWVMIGLRDPLDGMYKYQVHSGMRPDAWENQRAKIYTAEDFNLVVPGKYAASEISRLSRVYLEEDNPLGQEALGTVNRPVLLGARRKSDSDALEADFIDTLIIGPGNDFLGWIEYSGTVTGTYPDPMTIRHIELYSTILAVALWPRIGRA